MIVLDLRSLELASLLNYFLPTAEQTVVHNMELALPTVFGFFRDQRIAARSFHRMSREHMTSSSLNVAQGS